MSSALMERPIAAPAVTADELDLVKRTVASGATDAELKLYLYDCQRHGVHPLDKLLHFTKRADKYTPITSIDLMRIRAADTGECLGITDPAFVDTPKGEFFSATVTVKRLVQGQVAEFTATARWPEYYPGEQQGHMWRKMPHTMLGKCAEALALRKGFPKQLAGLYAREEMDQAESAPHPATVTRPGVALPAPADVDTATGEVIEPPPPPAAEDAPERAPLPVGAVYIDKCEPGSGRLTGTLTLSDARTVKVWADQRAYALAEQMCQDGDPAVIETKPSEKWGESLKTLKRWTAATAYAQPITAEDIAF